MKRLLILAVLSLFTFSAISGVLSYKNKIVTNPIITVDDKSDLTTRISVFNNNRAQPELFYFICNRKIERLETFFYLKDTGVKVDNADFFIIQLYPPNTTHMTAPYYPPAITLFDSFIGVEKFGSALSKLQLGGPGYVVFNLEKISITEGVLHQGWSQMYPLESFKTPFKGHVFRNCKMLETQTLKPL